MPEVIHPLRDRARARAGADRRASRSTERHGLDARARARAGAAALPRLRPADHACTASTTPIRTAATSCSPTTAGSPCSTSGCSAGSTTTRGRALGLLLLALAQNRAEDVGDLILGLSLTTLRSDEAGFVHELRRKLPRYHWRPLVGHPRRRGAQPTCSGSRSRTGSALPTELRARRQDALPGRLGRPRARPRARSDRAARGGRHRGDAARDRATARAVESARARLHAGSSRSCGCRGGSSSSSTGSRRARSRSASQPTGLKELEHVAPLGRQPARRGDDHRRRCWSPRR